MRNRRVPQPYWYANVCLTDPTTLEEAFSSDQHEDWKLALHEEVNSLSQQNVFDVVDKAPGMKTLPCKWVFKVKYDQDGNVQRFKARLVAKGFKQVSGVDFNETFAHVAKQSTLRLLWTFVRSRALTLRTFVGCHLRSCVLHARMSGEYAHSMAASSTAEDRLSSLGRSLSVPFTAGMGIDLRGPSWVPFSSKVLDQNSVVVP